LAASIPDFAASIPGLAASLSALPPTARAHVLSLGPVDRYLAEWRKEVFLAHLYVDDNTK
jgi:hypothetical protein